jgi:hypothetical protein
VYFCTWYHRWTLYKYLFQSPRYMDDELNWISIYIICWEKDPYDSIHHNLLVEVYPTLSYMDGVDHLHLKLKTSFFLCFAFLLIQIRYYKNCSVCNHGKLYWLFVRFIISFTNVCWYYSEHFLQIRKLRGNITLCPHTIFFVETWDLCYRPIFYFKVLLCAQMSLY